MTRQTTVAREVITPAMAIEILTNSATVAAILEPEKNANRTIRRPHVNALARDMRTGHWYAGVAVIRIDWHGIVRDGQHCLNAIVESATQQVFTVVRNDDPANQKAVDIGRHRSFSDQLELDSEPNRGLLSAAVSCVWTYERVGVLTRQSTGVTPNYTELFSVRDRHPGLREFTSNPHRLRGVIQPAPFSAFRYLASLNLPADLSNFTEKLLSGENLVVGSPVLALRDRLAHITKSTEIPVEIKCAFLVRCFNAFVNGTAIRKLVFRTGGTSPDRVPLIHSCPVMPGAPLRSWADWTPRETA